MRNLTQVRISGFGGQGVILSAIVIGKAGCIFENGYSTMTQSFGPEARGGACSAQVILSNEPILYPYVTRPDILVTMSQEAYSLFTPQLKEDGILIIEQDLVRVEKLPAGVRVYGVPATRLAEDLGKRMVLNIVMVGFFSAVTNLLEPEAVRQSVFNSVPEAFRELNLRAFDKGFEYASKHLNAGVEKEEPEIEVSTLEQ